MLTNRSFGSVVPREYRTPTVIFVAAGLAALLVLLVAMSAGAHQLWVETEATAAAGRAQEVHVCWGHAGHRESGESLARQEGKVTAWVVRPDGTRRMLDTTMGPDSFATQLTAEDAGFHYLGARVEIGVLTREFHGYAEGTRLVMHGKTWTHVSGSNTGREGLTGAELEIVPVSDLREIRPGDTVAARVLLHGKPIGGIDVNVVLSTCAPEPEEAVSPPYPREWRIEAYADPRNGEITFPLIAPGQHTVYVRYLEEQPGRYQGDLEFETAFSRLQPGSDYSRSLHVATFTFDVGH
jgi:uncharacterized GH25 family protein